MENSISTDLHTTNCDSRKKVRREHKGYSLLIPTDNYVVIDIETTGLDPARDSIIELGAVGRVKINV